MKIRGLLGTMALVAGVATLTACNTNAAQVQPKTVLGAVILRLNDLPTGFTLKSDKIEDNIAAAKTDPLHQSVAQIIKNGRVLGEDREYDRLVFKGLTVIDVSVQLYTSTAKARSLMLRSEAHAKTDGHFKPMSVGVVGEDRRGFSVTDKTGTLPLTFDAIEFYRGPVEVLLIAGGVTGTFDPDDILKFARLMDTRIQAVVK